jgi:RHS repeat-associated protein
VSRWHVVHECGTCIYGSSNMTFEQINNEGKVLYLHHDQQGSTRIRNIGATMTYDAYGKNIENKTAVSPLTYDAQYGQYTYYDGGLIYMRARTYDPATGQFLSRDPMEPLTREPYSYANDNPLNYGDPTGLFPWEAVAEGLGVGAACLFGGPAVCVTAGLIAVDYHVVKADFHSAETGCGPWSEITPALVAAGVSTLPFGGGLVAKDVWETSRAAFRIGAAGGIVSGGLTGTAVASNNNVSCGC